MLRVHAHGSSLLVMTKTEVGSIVSSLFPCVCLISINFLAGSTLTSIQEVLSLPAAF